jgi:[NiFe] hydrogenase assembly HybE family chaperone
MAVRVFGEDPSPFLEAAFRRIDAERMADLPFRNSALRVEALGFRRHDEQWLGVLVTPWTMNLVLLPATADSWIGAPEGRRLMIRYPAGDMPFLGGEEAEIGEYLVCPLFASMAQFPDQDAARLTAKASLIALLNAAPASDPVPNKVESPSRRRLFVRGS